VPEEWEDCLEAWILIAERHLSFSATELSSKSAHDDSLIMFLVSYMSESTQSPDLIASGSSPNGFRLRKYCYFLSCRLLKLQRPPDQLLTVDFLSDFCKVYGKRSTSKVLEVLWTQCSAQLEKALAAKMAVLTEELNYGIKGDPQQLEQKLKRLVSLLHSSPEAAAYFLSGSDFIDGMISCYKLMNPPLRKAIVSTLYLCLVGLTEGTTPKLSLLTDQLYALKAAADAHKAGPLNVRESLVAELITSTPILDQLEERFGSSENGSARLRTVIAALKEYRKPGGTIRSRPRRKHHDKGKGAAVADDSFNHENNGVHVHQLSLISQIQDLFPDLGSAFVTKLLVEYDDEVEVVITHLLEDSLPPHLREADRSEILPALSPQITTKALSHVPRSPIQLPSRANIFDDDELDQLVVGTSRLHIGKRNAKATADDVLKDRSTAPNKAAILSALAAFDSDDDERDDTYDVEDVGGTVDSATPGNNPEESNFDKMDAQDEPLFRAYRSNKEVFTRDAATRRSKERSALKEETGMTDEAIEGWALMLSRDPRKMRRLEARFSGFSGAQRELTSTAWRADPSGSGTEESDSGTRGGRGGFRGRGGRGRGGRGRGNVAGPSGERETEVARQRKEANKGSRANHNRRDQRARKVARAGFPG
jgi:activating signal cointegrator complex subunit 2